MLRIRDEQLEEIVRNLGMPVEGLVVQVEVASPPTTKPNYGMLYIREEQDSAMATEMMERFISKTLLLLEERVPGWCRAKSLKERERFVNNMIEFARSKFIYKEINIQKLIVWHLENGLVIPLTKYLESMLSADDNYEDYRIEQLYKSMTSSVELIDLALNEDLYGK